ncbi:MAG: hypothetical protein Q8M07_20865 [Prosthecobacter sp.]|nr:hypothetical protein [Prosthecobacter sp.]
MKEETHPMTESYQKTVERMQRIADQPRSFAERLKTMNDLYETNSFHPPVQPAPPALELDE